MRFNQPANELGWLDPSHICALQLTLLAWACSSTPVIYDPLCNYQSLPDFSDVPLDPRHELARESKRRGFDRRGAASIADFPKEWL